MSVCLGVHILIAVGAVMMLVGFLGCYGAIQESQCLLGTVSHNHIWGRPVEILEREIQLYTFYICAQRCMCMHDVIQLFQRLHTNIVQHVEWTCRNMRQCLSKSSLFQRCFIRNEIHLQFVCLWSSTECNFSCCFCFFLTKLYRGPLTS